MSNVIMDGGGEDGRNNVHEARMIPGLSRKVWGFPNSILTKLRYCDVYNVTSTIGARSINVYAANGIFDPDISGVGHQPLYRDNWVNIYDQYVVIGSKITVTFSPTSATVPMICGIAGNDDTTVQTSVIALQEINNASSLLMGTAGSQPVTLSSTFEPLEMFGVDAKADGASQTNVGSNPTELWCWGIWTATADGTSTASASIKIEIEYTVKFAELTDQTVN